jgi:hypothetical protein
MEVHDQTMLKKDMAGSPFLILTTNKSERERCMHFYQGMVLERSGDGVW